MFIGDSKLLQPNLTINSRSKRIESAIHRPGMRKSMYLHAKRAQHRALCTPSKQNGVTKLRLALPSGRLPRRERASSWKRLLTRLAFGLREPTTAAKAVANSGDGCGPPSGLHFGHLGCGEKQAMVFDVGDQVAGGRLADGRIETFARSQAVQSVVAQLAVGIAARAANALA